MGPHRPSLFLLIAVFTALFEWVTPSTQSASGSSEVTPIKMGVCSVSGAERLRRLLVHEQHLL